MHTDTTLSSGYLLHSLKRAVNTLTVIIRQAVDLK